MDIIDDLMTKMSSQVKGIPELFDSIFSFLLKRTDFYYEKDPSDKFGFPPGLAK